MNLTRPRSAVLAGVAALILLLVLAALLTPEQSPILPIELSVVLAAIGAWCGLRGSRAAFTTAAVFTLLLALLSAHILLGDLGEKGARELVPDVLILAASIATCAVAGVAVRTSRQLAR